MDGVPDYRVVEISRASGGRRYRIEYRLSDKTAFESVYGLSDFSRLRHAKKWIRTQQGLRDTSRRVVWP